MKDNLSAVVFIMLLAVLIGSACQKVVDIELKNADPVIVIEGAITNTADTQAVRISRSVPFGETNIFPQVTGATVTVTDQLGFVSTFRERAPGIYSSRRLRGIPGRTYSLKVVVDGKEYTASSTMPGQVLIDSIGISVTTIFNEEQKSVQVLFRDPGERQNFYKYNLSIAGKKSRSVFAFNDDFTNGKQVTRELFDLDLNAVKGDRAEVEMLCIDENMYRYWQGLDQNENRGGASTTPANPITNISNGALGYFSAHTSQKENIVIP